MATSIRTPARVARGHHVGRNQLCLVALALVACVASCGEAEARRAPPQHDAYAHLGHYWDETEGAWRGTWVRNPGRAWFDAVWWSQQHGRETATLRIRFEQQDVVVVERTQRHDSKTRGTCTYRGTLDRTRNRVAGRYSCTFGGTDLPWSAVIDPK
jgi:hypothetical protein